jgi:hypothetical protein
MNFDYTQAYNLLKKEIVKLNNEVVQKETISADQPIIEQFSLPPFTENDYKNLPEEVKNQLKENDADAFEIYKVVSSLELDPKKLTKEERTLRVKYLKKVKENITKYFIDIKNLATVTLKKEEDIMSRPAMSSSDFQKMNNEIDELYENETLSDRQKQMEENLIIQRYENQLVQMPSPENVAFNKLLEENIDSSKILLLRIVDLMIQECEIIELQEVEANKTFVEKLQTKDYIFTGIISLLVLCILFLFLRS